jgi:predicted amidophosphoribosyltransferase
MDFLSRLIEEHGWHVLGELALFVLAVVVTLFWVRALVQGRARPVLCPACGRVTSRANPRCPRCGAALQKVPGARS